MVSTKNQAAFLQAIENWNSGSLSAYLELYDQSVVLHGLPPGLPPGRVGARLFYEGIWTAFPAPHLIIHDIIIEGNRLACRYELEATHQGAFMGIPPTGKSVRVPGMTICRFEDGVCVERWNQADMLGWMQQLGAMPQ